MGERVGTQRAWGRGLVIRKRYPLAGLLILLAAVALSASVVTTNANALPTFTDAVGGIGPCDSCHTKTQVHSVAAHASMVGDPTKCVNCHLVNTATPPAPQACGACHGGVSQIIVATTHATIGCSTTPGCHGVPVGAAAITSITPAKAPVGTSVTIAGTGFGTTTGALMFGTTAATPTSWTGTKIVAKVPAGLIEGAVDVTVTPSGGTASAGFAFTVTTAVTSKVTLKLVGVRSGIIKFGKTLTAKGVVTPFHAGKVTITFQRKVSTKWVKMKVLTRTSAAATGTYSAMYKPTRKGSWRAVVTVGKVTIGTTTFSAATTLKTFKVT